MIPKYLIVAVPVPLRRSFHYLPPEGFEAADCRVGARVEVQFGRQNLVGFIIGHAETSEFASRVKPATRLIDDQGLLPSDLYDLSLWAADYYHHPLGEVLSTAVPVLLRQGREATGSIAKLTLTHADLDDLRVGLSRAPRQLALVNFLAQRPRTRAELNDEDFGASLITALLNKQAACWERTELALTPADSIEFGRKLELNQEQTAALNGIKKTGTHLLFGITGSGKTEVYLQAIERVLRQGEQALVLVPEIGLTTQTIARFEQRFPGQVVAMHSGLTNNDRLDAWRLANSDAAAVVVGTRSAIFTALKHPGLIVVDEEHDASFKQQEGFRYSARDLAVKRGQLESIPVVLGSATPSLETLANAKSGRYQRYDLTHRANLAKTASYQIIGIEHQTMTEGFSPQLVTMMKEHLAANNQVLVFLNRRGFAPVLHCRQCGWLSDCNRCDSRMTYHLSTKMLICHHCDNQHRAPTHCPDCGSTELVPLGLGTQRLEHGLNQLFPDEHIVRIDRDSTRKKDALEKKLEEVKTGERCILLGTQLLAKGHHFPDVTLVAIIDLDSGLFSSDYHAVERMGQLLMQVGGRAGREQKTGKVAIQTLYPDQPMLKTLLKDGYEAFCEELLKERKTNELPPSTYQAIIRAEATQAGSALKFLGELNQAPAPHVELLGPVPAPMEKRAGRFRAQLLVSSKSRNHLHGALRQLTQIAEGSSLSNKVRWSLDVDPYDLF
jgi:primosomal protein N' (replication factor Y)